MITKTFLLLFGIFELLIVILSIKFAIDKPKENTILVAGYAIIVFLFSIDVFYQTWKSKKNNENKYEV